MASYPAMKILLVEDEPVLLMAMRHFLEEEKFIVTTAATYNQASVAVHDYDYDYHEFTLQFKSVLGN